MSDFDPLEIPDFLKRTGDDMARKRKAKAPDIDETEEAAAEVENGSANGIGHNSELTDEQRQALFFSHKKAYQAALAAKKKADAELKNVAKQAKAELGDDAVPSIKIAIELETEEGEARVRANIDMQMRVARWMAVPFGTQADLFTDHTDPRPATERAFEEGRRAGMEAAERKPPYDPSVPQHQSWLEGYAAGQTAIFNIQKTRDAKLFDAEAAGEA